MEYGAPRVPDLYASTDTHSCLTNASIVSTFQECGFPSVFVILQGENLVTAVLTGPGIVFIQSLPFHRLSQRIAR